jgi:hypothetical protein
LQPQLPHPIQLHTSAVLFYFSSYKSNPLAAISTTLRRLAKNEELIETAEIDGVNVYRLPSAMDKMAEIVGKMVTIRPKKSAAK